MFVTYLLPRCTVVCFFVHPFKQAISVTFCHVLGVVDKLHVLFWVVVSSRVERCIESSVSQTAYACVSTGGISQRGVRHCDDVTAAASDGCNVTACRYPLLVDDTSLPVLRDYLSRTTDMQKSKNT